MQANGDLGLIATNTVAQGDTREVGLEAMVAAGFTITRAIQSRSWPAASANLEYAAVWGSLAPVAEELPRIADDVEVRGITTLLEAAGRADGMPIRLLENEGIGFVGNTVNGGGFIIDPAVARIWMAEDERTSRVLFPYLNGDDLNSRPDASASRWIIDFFGMSDSEAASFNRPFVHLAEHVRPIREAGSAALRRAPWWLFWRPGPALRKAVRDLSEVLVIARVSKTVMPLRTPTGQVMSEACVVFATADYGDQAVLSSSLHQLWAITYGSGMRNDPRYTPSDVFETFPRPAPTAALEGVGRALDQERREMMLRRDLGLTRLYNRVNDSALPDSADRDVARLRQIHVELDRTVLHAYGWTDVDLAHGFHEYRKMERWTICPAARVEILDRLLEENHRRASAEQSVGHASRNGVIEEETGATLFD